MTTTPQTQTWHILSPVGQPAERLTGSAEPTVRFAKLAPRDVVTICRNGWPSWARIAERLADELRSDERSLDVRVVDVPLGRALPEREMHALASESQLVVFGLANCGSCTVATMQNFQLLNGKVPAVIAATERFLDLARSLAPDAPIIELPHDIEQRSAPDWDDLAALVKARVAGSTEAEARRAG